MSAVLQRPDATTTQPGSAGFAELLGAYRRSGGTTRGDDLAALLAHHRRADYVSLARLIAARDVFGFEWRGTLWIPMFQFDADDLSVQPGARQVLGALARGMDGWTLAAWFADGHAQLGGERPVDLLDRDLAAVLGAARADCLVVAGAEVASATTARAGRKQSFADAG